MLIPVPYPPRKKEEFVEATRGIKRITAKRNEAKEGVFEYIMNTLKFDF